MVELTTGGYLFKAMLAIRPLRVSGQGTKRSVDWPEIDSFRRATGAVDKGLDCQVLYEMCEAFLNGYSVGETPMGIPPIERP